ncbi:thiolase-like protein [Pelagophyceae sp. CCMP2097]|nr:thiolase-like protein [Pelagophyceae sp. CCMP2097]
MQNALVLLLASPALALQIGQQRAPRAAARRRVRTGASTGMTMAEAPPYRRVVVTGMGLCSCLGNTLDDVADSLYNAKPGIMHNAKYAEIGMKSQVCGRPDMDLENVECIDRKSARFMGENAKYAYISMYEAIKDSGMAPEVYENNPRAGGILGQGGTSIPDVGATLDAVAEGKLKKVGPYRVTRTMGSTVSAVLTTAFKLRGSSYSISSACSTGAHCIGVGMEQIQLNKHDIIFAGAGELENWGSTVMFDGMGALSSKYNDSPTTASRAFDKDRDGFVIAAGGGIVILEELEHAKARGAKIYGELVGYSATSDGYDMVAPSGEGGERAMRDAMAMADALGGKKEVDYINTHGTSTPVGDVKELGAIRNAFADKGYYPNIGSTKSLSGHALSVAGVHEAIYSLIMMQRGFLAESANIVNIVDEAEGMPILRARKEQDVNRVMSNSFGFGGTNACLIFDKYSGN